MAEQEQKIQRAPDGAARSERQAERRRARAATNAVIALRVAAKEFSASEDSTGLYWMRLARAAVRFVETHPELLR